MCPITERVSPAGGLQTVQRALQVLELFTSREPEWGVTEAAERLGIAKSMTHRLFATLAEHGFIQQNPKSRRYRLGLRLLGLGALVGDHLEIRRIALPHMEALARAVGETVFLTVLDRDFAMAVARVEAGPTVNWVMGIGERFPLVAGASNRVILAYLDAAERERILASVAGQIDGERLRADIAWTRQHGYAVSMGEVTFQTAAVAVPILSQSGRVIAGVSVAGPMARFSPARISELATAIQETALVISRHYPYSDCTVG